MMNDFASQQKKSTVFIVKNITLDRNKTIKIFHYPIPYGKTRDILAIPGVGEADIRASLLKGELLHKILCKDIVVIDSDIDLLQFNNEQKLLLQKAGVIKGLEIATIQYLWKENVPIIGLKNNNNRTFYTPDKFLNGSHTSGDSFHITLNHNGRELYENIDYTIGESSGPGTGYDILNIISFSPLPSSILMSTYAIKK